MPDDIIDELIPHQKIETGEQKKLSRTTAVIVINHAPGGDQPREMAVRRDMVSGNVHDAIVRVVECPEGVPVPLPLYWIDNPGLLVFDHAIAGTVNRDVSDSPAIDIIGADGVILFSLPLGLFAVLPTNKQAAETLRMVARGGACSCRVAIYPE
jgi:hypothetical protein